MFSATLPLRNICRKLRFTMRTLAALLSLALLASCASKPEPQSVKAATAEPATESSRPSLAQQKMCAEQAQKTFDDYKVETRSMADQIVRLDYTSHFDPRRNVCYVRIQHINLAGGVSTTSTFVLDAFERRIFANYGWSNPQHRPASEVTPLICEVHPPNQDKITCGSGDEFNALAEKWFGVAE